MDPTLLLPLSLILLVGISLGLLGSGGAIFTLPILVYLAGVPAHQAVGITSAAIGVSSAIGAGLHARHGHVHWPAVWMMGPAGIVGALVGSQFTHFFTAGGIQAIFAGVMLVVGVTLIRQRAEPACGHGCRVRRCMPIGFGVGAMTGFLGVGGGFLIMPSLVYLAGVETKHAVGASLAIIALNATAGLLGHLTRIDIDWRLTGLVLAAILGGLLIGELLCDHLSARLLRRIFAWLITAVALALLAIDAWLHLR
jgi:hypothetical protein